MISQQSTQSFPARYLTGSPIHFEVRNEQLIANSLMVALSMIVVNVTERGDVQRFLTEEDHAFKALLLDGLHEAFKMRTKIW
jgi:hypothetical protein